MTRTLLVGRSSLLASWFVEHAGDVDLRRVSHDESDWPSLFDGVGCVVNFAYHPKYPTSPYAPEIDFDRRLADAIGSRGVHYVMLSSRKVYGDAVKFGASETDAAEGCDQYSRNKAATEAYLRETLGERLTVLRIANVIGYERVPGRKRFMALVLHRLKTEGRIVYDMNPFVRRDFVTDRFFADILRKVIELRPSGIFNLGSGIPLETGWIAMWVLEGYGKGELVVESPRVVDEYVPNVRKQTDTFGLSLSVEDIRNHCVNIGRRLARE